MHWALGTRITSPGHQNHPSWARESPSELSVLKSPSGHENHFKTRVRILTTPMYQSGGWSQIHSTFESVYSTRVRIFGTWG